MEVGTQILIDRMKTNPEEFGEGSISKWGRVWAYAMEHLPDEDKQALREANRRMRVEKFNEMVMTTLAGENDSVEETLTYKASGRYTTGWTDPRGLYGNSIADTNAATNVATQKMLTDELREWAKGIKNADRN